MPSRSQPCLRRRLRVDAALPMAAQLSLLLVKTSGCQGALPKYCLLSSQDADDAERPQSGFSVSNALESFHVNIKHAAQLGQRRKSCMEPNHAWNDSYVNKFDFDGIKRVMCLYSWN